jgi:hypothetical protein
MPAEHGQERRWTLYRYRDNDQWRVRSADVPRHGAKDYEVVEVVPADRERVLVERMARAEAVASYWRDEAMKTGEEPLVPWRTMAHPLACTLAALLGEETEPDQLGITEGEFAERYPKALAALETVSEDSEHPADHEWISMDNKVITGGEMCWTCFREGKPYVPIRGVSPGSASEAVS